MGEGDLVRQRKPKREFVDCPFTVLVDTREQLPFGFASIRADAKDNAQWIAITTKRQTLATGDYSIEGHEGIVVVERKGFDDLYNCCGCDRDRFENQVRRLNELPEPYIVVEASWESVLNGHSKSALRPKSIHRTVISWQRRYRNVHWWFIATRLRAEATTFRILERYWKDLER
jgi:ERCC4-type nuclease